MGAIASKQVSSAELRCAIKSFNTELEQILRKHRSAVEIFIRDYGRWLQKRMAVIEALSSLQRTIDKHHHNVNIASISGSSVSLVSGAACIAGLALAPFTGGFSIALSAGGLLGTSAGTLTSVGARLVDFGMSKKAVNKALNLVDEDCQETMHLSHLIELCVKHQTEIESFVMDVDIISVIKQNEDILMKLLTTPLLKERFGRIKKGTATVDDVLIIISLVCSDDLVLLKKIHSAKKTPIVELKLMEGTVKVAAALRSSVINIRKCVVFFKDWKMGLNSLGMATKATRLAKGAVVGLSMAIDAYEVSSTAKEMVCGQKSDSSRYLHALIEELEHQTQDISLFYSNLNV